MQFPISVFRLAVAGGALLTFTALASTANAQTFTTQSVAATANLVGAGRTGAALTPGGGTVAPTFLLTAGTGRILTFSSVTGSITYNGGGNFNDPDGVGNPNSTNYSAYQGISGVSFTGRAGYLLGVFINGAPAGFADGSTGSSAPNLAFSSASVSAPSFTPLLNQAFFAGDGLTGDGTGTIQQFFVPDTATALVLGFEDGGGYVGGPGAFADNSGAFTASFNITGTGTAAAPEPSALALLAPALGLIGMVASRRRR